MNTSTQSVSETVIHSMFKHLAASYSSEDARTILKQKYPHDAEAIDQFESHQSDIIENTSVSQEDRDKKLKAAVKQKISKPKAEKPKTDSKISRARDLYASALDKSRPVIIDLFMKELDMSQSVATSYFYNIKRTT